MGLAILNHTDAQKIFPTGGWGGAWVGDPDRGFAKEQPGGWIHNVLPFLEEQPLRDMGRNATSDADKRRLLGQRDGRAVSSFNCPSRRPPIAYPNDLNFTPVNADRNSQHARADYAACAGGKGRSVERLCGAGPNSYQHAASGFRFPTIDLYDGISHCASEVKLRNVPDGLSKTYAVGERYIDPEHYFTGVLHSNDWSMYVGIQDDIYRSTHYDPLRNVRRPPTQDTAGVQLDENFGGPHPGGCQFVFCDGSVQNISFDVDLQVHSQYGSRDDGGTFQGS